MGKIFATAQFFLRDCFFSAALLVALAPAAALADIAAAFKSQRLAALGAEHAFLHLGHRLGFGAHIHHAAAALPGADAAGAGGVDHHRADVARLEERPDGGRLSVGDAEQADVLRRRDGRRDHQQHEVTEHQDRDAGRSE